MSPGRGIDAALGSRKALMRQVRVCERIGCGEADGGGEGEGGL